MTLRKFITAMGASLLAVFSVKVSHSEGEDAKIAEDPVKLRKKQILGRIRERMVDVRPELTPEEILPEKGMTDYGLDSVDRMDVILMLKEEFSPKSKLIEFFGAHSIGDLVDLLYGLEVKRKKAQPPSTSPDARPGSGEAF
jgi:acyl carrier protein